MIKINEIKRLNSSTNKDFKDLMDKKRDAIVLNKICSTEKPPYYNKQLANLQNISKNIIIHQNLTTYPLSYAVIHEKNDREENEHLLNTFFKEGENANKNYEKIIGAKTTNALKNILEATFPNIKLLSKGENAFPMFNLRKMNPAPSYAIEIHCENSFINQLNIPLKEFLYETVDLENALSFYLMLQAPDFGGDLILFDKTWDEQPIAAGNLDEKTRKNERLFFNSNTGIPHKKISLTEGDMVFFRAAQIWHCIDVVSGASPRITIGGFVGRSIINQNQYFYWS